MRRFIVGSVLLGTVLLIPLSVGAQTTKEEFQTGQVIDATQTQQEADGETSIVQKLTIRLTSGPDAGKSISVENDAISDREDLLYKKGEMLVVDTLTRADGSVEYMAKERYRLPGMGWALLLFLGLTVVLGGLRGISSILGLVVSILLLAKLIIPLIIAGYSPLLVSIVGSCLIATSSLYLAHGFNRRTSVALLSTLLTLVLAIVVALLFVSLGRLFGMGSEQTLYLQLGQFSHLNFRGLLLGGIIIGCLGVLDDVTTAQTASVDEISKANPTLTRHALFRSGMSVGREHIASLINTLALAYVGASLPLLLLFSTDTDSPLWVILNGEAIAEEVIRTLVGSATLLLAVPISTWFAALLLKTKEGTRPVVAVGGHHH